MRSLNGWCLKLIAPALLWACAGISAQAAAITCLTNNSTQCSTVASEITVLGSLNTLTISNVGPLAFAIDIVYFDPTPDNSITGISIGAATGTVAFTTSSCNPSNLPAGNNASPAFVSLFNACSTSNANRIDAGESLAFSATGGNLGTLVENGTVRIGLHVQSVGTSGQSESLITGTGGSVPEPMTWSLVGAGLLGLGVFRRRFSS